MEPKKVVSFEQEGVFVNFYMPDCDKDCTIGGTLQIIVNDISNQLEWKPHASAYPEPNPESETQTLVGSSSAVLACGEVHESAIHQEITSDMRLPSPDMKNNSDADWSMVSNNPNSSQNLKDEPFDVAMDEITSQSPKDRHYNLAVPLEDIRLIKLSKKEIGWKYLVVELAEGVRLPAFHFYKGGCEKFLKALEIYVFTNPSTKHPNSLEVSPHNSNALTLSFDQLNIFGENALPKLSTRILQRPVTSAFSGFSRVTNYLQDLLNPAETVPQSRPANERATLIKNDSTEDVGLSRFQIKREEDESGGFEVITCAELGPRPNPPRDPPMSVEFWNSHKDESGRMVGVEEIKMTIFKGGIDPVLRKEVWKYLLNYFPWNMTRDELKEHKRKKEDEYYRMKLQWKSVSKDQETRFSDLREHKSLIEKDVARNDRNRLFYKEADCSGLTMLHDVLVTYVMYNFDLGYVQGMSDLLSPILEFMGSDGNEADAFWCFVGYMNIVQRNFEESQQGIKKQLQNLRTLLHFLDVKFFDNLSEKESNNLYFCFRWLLLRFKREFSYEDLLTLWEVMWTELPCPNFHLIICIALLDTEKSTLMHEDCGFTEILKHINNLSENIDLEATLRKAEGIYLQLSNCRRDLSDAVRNILGLIST